MTSIIARRSSGESWLRRWCWPTGYRGSLMIREVYLRSGRERSRVVLLDGRHVLDRLFRRVRTHLRDERRAGVVRGERVVDVAVELLEKLAQVLRTAED